MKKYLTPIFVLLFLLIFSSCISTIKLNYIHNNIEFPILYYVVSDKNQLGILGFNSPELKIMEKSISDWESKTNNITDITLIHNWEPPTKFDPNIYTKFRIKTVWKLNWKDDIVQELFEKLGPFCGLSWGDAIIIIDDERCPYLYETFTNEIGNQFKH